MQMRSQSRLRMEGPRLYKALLCVTITVTRMSGLIEILLSLRAYIT